jgi:hypothetical protein
MGDAAPGTYRGLAVPMAEIAVPATRRFMYDTEARRPMFRATRLREDERGIEGLPVRLVIALVVGVASLSVMMSMISGISGLAVTELDVRPTPEVTTPDNGSVSVAVVDPDGGRVADATVVARGGSARLDGVATAKTDENGTAEFDIDPELGPNQRDGTVVFDIKPPAGSDYADRRENTALLVVEK